MDVLDLIKNYVKCLHSTELSKGIYFMFVYFAFI